MAVAARAVERVSSHAAQRQVGSAKEAKASIFQGKFWGEVRPWQLQSIVPYTVSYVAYVLFAVYFCSELRGLPKWRCLHLECCINPLSLDRKSQQH